MSIGFTCKIIFPLSFIYFRGKSENLPESVEMIPASIQYKDIPIACYTRQPARGAMLIEVEDILDENR